ncbi:SH3 domain-containing protein [Bowmanella denitrificans]
MLRYIVVTAHQSEYPAPIEFTKGTVLTIGEKYAGPEDWQDWYFCSTNRHPGGWVPAQVFHLTSEDQGLALEDYSAKELNVAAGEYLIGGRMLNGWVWATRQDSTDQGWVPMDNLKPLNF